MMSDLTESANVLSDGSKDTLEASSKLNKLAEELEGIVSSGNIKLENTNSI